MNGQVARRDWALVVALAGLMFLVILLSARQDAGDPSLPALTTHSTSANGARALMLWLKTLGHPVRQGQGVSFELERSDRLLFVLAPQQTFSAGQIKHLDSWIKAGGTLILATNQWSAGPLLEHFEVDVDFLDQEHPARPAQPLLLDPPWTEAQVGADYHLITARDDVVTLASAGGRPVLLAFEHGAGQVFVSATAYPFTNVGLRDPGNARLVHNLVATVEPGAPVVFDEFHHGYQTARTLTTWLKVTPQGRSLIYAGLVLFVYLLVGGRRFGRPLPMARPDDRRAPIEHIQAMANLFRRGGKRAAILEHYHDRLKRELAQPYHLDPTLADDDFVARLSGVRPELDGAALSRLLRETRQRGVSEGELISLAKEVDDWIEKTN